MYIHLDVDSFKATTKIGWDAVWDNFFILALLSDKTIYKRANSYISPCTRQLRQRLGCEDDNTVFSWKKFSYIPNNKIFMSNCYTNLAKISYSTERPSIEDVTDRPNVKLKPIVDDSGFSKASYSMLGAGFHPIIWNGFIKSLESETIVYYTPPSTDVVGMLIPELKIAIVSGSNYHNEHVYKDYVKLVPTEWGWSRHKVVADIIKKKYGSRKAIDRNPNDITLIIGCDPELEMVKDGKIVSGMRHYPHRSSYVGLDGAGYQIELRPKPSNVPSRLVENIKETLQEASDFAEGFSVKGDVYPLGFHIHFSSFNHPYLRPTIGLLKLLDNWLFFKFEGKHGAARGRYKIPSAYECRKTHGGWEYKSLPGSVLQSPELTRIVLKLAYNIANRYYTGLDLPLSPEMFEDELEGYKYFGLTNEEYNVLTNFEPEEKISAAWKIKEEEE